MNGNLPIEMRGRHAKEVCALQWCEKIPSWARFIWEKHKPLPFYHSLKLNFLVSQKFSEIFDKKMHPSINKGIKYQIKLCNNVAQLNVCVHPLGLPSIFSSPVQWKLFPRLSWSYVGKIKCKLKPNSQGSICHPTLPPTPLNGNVSSLNCMHSKNSHAIKFEEKLNEKLNRVNRALQGSTTCSRELLACISE